MNKIRVLWTEAIRLEDVSMSSYAGNCGLYQILVKEDSDPESERLIYLGKTNGTFLRRICQHLSGIGGSGTFLKVKGKKFIRFGLIPRPFKCSDKTYRRMLDHAEAVDIERLHPELNKKAGYHLISFLFRTCFEMIDLLFYRILSDCFSWILKEQWGSIVTEKYEKNSQ